MRTNVVIDDELMAQAMAYSGLKTKRAVIEEALRTLITLKSQEQVRELKGELPWDGDLNVMREGRYPEVNR
jgi:Arc/MetJ family transcription regulator